MANTNFKLTIVSKIKRNDIRHKTHQKATELNIRGYICLLPDMGVEVSAEGEETSLNILFDYLKELICEDSIQSIDIEWGNNPVKDVRFSIKHSM